MHANNLEQYLKHCKFWDLPGGAVVGSPPAYAGGVGSGPGPGGSHVPLSSWARASRLLSLRSGVREPRLLGPCATTAESPRAWSPCSAAGEATAVRSPCSAARSGPHSLQLGKARVQ